MTELEQNVKKVLSTVNGRATVLAATKTVAPERINLIYDMGIHTIGENRVQELLEKYDELDKRFDIHFIGRLQRNKVKYIIGKVSLIHSLDSVPLAEEIDRRSEAAGLVTSCLVEVNAGCEESKGGITPEELPSFLEKISSFRHIKVRGLMTIPPKCEDSEKKLEYFRKIRGIFIDNRAKKVDNSISMDVLSMGMTHDYPEALQCGATIVRIGEGIFGKRIYNTNSEE